MSSCWLGKYSICSAAFASRAARCARRARCGARRPVQARSRRRGIAAQIARQSVRRRDRRSADRTADRGEIARRSPLRGELRQVSRSSGPGTAASSRAIAQFRRERRPGWAMPCGIPRLERRSAGRATQEIRRGLTWRVHRSGAPGAIPMLPRIHERAGAKRIRLERYGGFGRFGHG